LLSPDALATPGPWGVTQQSGHANLTIALTPQQNRRAGNAQLLSQVIIGNPLRRSQDDPSAKGHLLRGVTAAHQAFEEIVILRGQKQTSGRGPHTEASI